MRIRNSIGTVIYAYQEGIYNSGAQTFTWTISTTALSMATGLYYFDFNFVREYFEPKSATYNISLQRLDSTTSFTAIRQFGQSITPTLGKYIIYDSSSDSVTVILNFEDSLYNTKVNGLSVTLTVEGTSISVTNATNSAGDVWLTFLITELPGDYNIDISWAQSATINSGSQQDIIVITASYRDLIYHSLSANDGHALTLVDFEFQFAFIGNDIEIKVNVKDLQNNVAYNSATLNITLKGGNSYLDTAGTLGEYSIIIPHAIISQGINEFVMNINAQFLNNITVEFNISTILKAQVRFTLIEPPSIMGQDTEYTITLFVEYLPDGETTSYQ
jgi:hypothetical protein